MLYYLSKAIWDVVAPSRVLEFLTIAAGCAAILGSRRAILPMILTATTLLLIGFFPIGGWLMEPLETRFPRWQSTPAPPPYGIIALGGDTGHRVEELDRASNLFPNALLIYSGRGDRQAAELELRHASLDPSRVIIESSSRTTAENAADSAQLIRPKPNERWLLVTSAAHMPRAIGCFRQVGFNVIADPVDYHTDPTSYVYANTPEQRIAQTDDAIREWLGLIAYRLLDETTALVPGP